VGEFELIDRFFAKLGATRSDVLLGVGDDAALLVPPPDEVLALCVDTLFFKYKIHMVTETFHVLKNSGERARFARFGHSRVKRHRCEYNKINIKETLY
jgi:hypothetical protein